MILDETRLDDEVRSTFFVCRKYDWNCKGAPVLEKVFPDGVLSPIVHVSRDLEQERVARTIACLSAIAPPDNGPLADAITALETALTKATEAQEVYEKSILKESKSKALENLAKKEYVEQYNAVYYQACGDIGRAKANRLFPVVRSGKKKTPQHQDNSVQTLSVAA